MFARFRIRVVLVASVAAGLGAVLALGAWAIAGSVCLLLVVAYFVWVERPARREDRRRVRRRQFRAGLQGARTQAEVNTVVKLAVERAVPGGRAVVLSCDGLDRLVPVTPVVPGSPLSALLEAAPPDACLAVRLGRTHVQGPESEELLLCELCAANPEMSTCVPSLAGGEIIGSVQVEHDQPLSGAELDELTRTVAGAAPVMANLRNLATAERRAATDALTGLPNQRAVTETLIRMAAQAGRSTAPLSAVMVDLDHLKSINESHGHDRGDEVLAAAAHAATGVLRASDFIGRYGGEEFLLLLPDTDRDGAAAAAEKVREAIAALRITGVAHPITASFGVASLPADAGEPQGLMRAADRALYAAKANGRNRVELVAYPR